MSELWDKLWRGDVVPGPDGSLIPTTHHTTGHDNTPQPVTEGSRRYALAALEDECADVAAMPPDSGRNSRLNDAAFKMARHIGAGNIDAGTVRRSLEQAAQACRLPQHEIDTTLRDAPGGGLVEGQTHPRHPRALEPVPEPTVLHDADITDEQDVSAIIREKFPLLNWRELWDTEDDEEWIIEPLIPARRLVALFSPPKAGKSLLMLEIAVGIARGADVLGVKPDRPRRVLYVDFENDPRGDIRERLQAMGREPEDLNDLCYLSYPSIAKLDTVAGGAELMAVVAEYRCEIVVIDTVSRAVAGEENDNDTWLAFYRNTGLAMKQTGVTCIRLDHTGKDAEKGMRGGSAKYGDVDVVWKLSRVTDEVYQLDCTDHRLPIAEKQIVLKRLEDPDLRHQVEGGGWIAASDAKVAEVVAALDIAEVPNDAGRPLARKTLKRVGVTAKDTVLNRALAERKRRVGGHP